ELVQHPAEPFGVVLVEGSVDLVEKRARRRVRSEDREEERDRRHRAFTAREQRDAAKLLSRRARADLDPGLERVRLVLEEDLGLPAVEQLAEDHGEVLAHGVEGLEEHGGRLFLDAAENLVQ